MYKIIAKPDLVQMDIKRSELLRILYEIQSLEKTTPTKSKSSLGVTFKTFAVLAELQGFFNTPDVHKKALLKQVNINMIRFLIGNGPDVLALRSVIRRRGPKIIKFAEALGRLYSKCRGDYTCILSALQEDDCKGLCTLEFAETSEELCATMRAVRPWEWPDVLNGWSKLQTLYSGTLAFSDLLRKMVNGTLPEEWLIYKEAEAKYTEYANQRADFEPADENKRMEDYVLREFGDEALAFIRSPPSDLHEAGRELARFCSGKQDCGLLPVYLTLRGIEGEQADSVRMSFDVEFTQRKGDESVMAAGRWLRNLIGWG